MKSTNNRIFLLSILAFLLGTVLIANVLLIGLKGKCIISNVDLTEYKNTSTFHNILYAKRGTIFDCNNNIIAEDRTTYNILFIIKKRYGINNTPAYVVDKEKTAQLVSEIIGCSAAHILSYLNLDLYQTEIGDQGRGLSISQKEAIEALKLPGIEFEKVISRYYPYQTFAANIVGYAYNMRDDNGKYSMEGLMGIERYLDEYLNGTNGLKVYIGDISGCELPNQTISYTASKDGCDVYLTLDANIQLPLNTCLESLTNISGIENSWGIVLEAKTGRIVGIGNYPSFNQNYPNVSDWLDYCSSKAYETGSLLKTITYAAAMDSNDDFDLNDTYDSSPMYYMYDEENDYVLPCSKNDNYVSFLNNFHDRNNRGVVNLDYAYAYSLNTGTAYILSKYLTTTKYKEYLDKFGFFKKVGVYGVNETTGVKNLNTIVDIVNSTYGQACSFTALQLVQAYTAFCNDGNMLKPYIIDKIVDSKTGEVKYVGNTEIAGTPISANTANEILALMKRAFNNYTSFHTKWTPNIISGGKTGTGEVSNSSGYTDETIHSILIVTPIDDPEYIILVSYKDNSIDQISNFQPIVRTMCTKILANYIQNDSENTNIIKKMVMPSLINHSKEYVNEKCQEQMIIEIGSGNTVISQYPLGNDTIISGQKIFVLYGNDGIKLPNMIGWSYKDILRYWDLSQIDITIEGDGYVYKQSVEPQTIITSNQKLYLYLK